MIQTVAGRVEIPSSETAAGAESAKIAKPLAGKVCLVTGASRGIGKATAMALAELGGTVAINYQNSKAAAESVCEDIGHKGGQARIYQADISRDSEAETMVARIQQEMGSIQVLVNNAGITRDKSFLKMTRMMWEEVLGVNLNGPFFVSHACLPKMVESGWGRIINVASIVGQTGSFGQANYAVTKGGMMAFTMTLAREVARKGITVNAVAPGYVETDMTRDVPQAVLDNVKAMTPVGRLGRSEEVAALIAFLASPAAGYITGQIIGVNGGMYM